MSVMDASRREAARKGAELVLPSHLLLALLDEGGCECLGAFRRVGVDVEGLRGMVSGGDFKEQTHPGEEAGFSVQALDAVSVALEYAGLAGHETVEPLHLLAGFAGTQSLDGSETGTSVFLDCGVDAEAVLQEVFRVLHHGQPPEDQSVARAAGLLATHPGADRVQRLLQRVRRLHDASLAEGDFERAVCIRGTMVQVARDERKPVGEWVKHARGMLLELLDASGTVGDEEE